jgi:hypothetical protein
MFYHMQQWLLEEVWIFTPTYQIHHAFPGTMTQWSVSLMPLFNFQTCLAGDDMFRKQGTSKHGLLTYLVSSLLSAHEYCFHCYYFLVFKPLGGAR